MRTGGRKPVQPVYNADLSDFRYRQTTATIDVRGFAFRATGRQPIDLGWRAAFSDWQPADEKGGEAQLLANQVLTGRTEDHREAAKAFVEKRPPAFVGR
jgi:DNA topoisomerase-3